jgi:hypothetical protein
MKEYIQTIKLNGVVNPTHLTSFWGLYLFDDLIIEVLKVINNAKKEIYFATMYHDRHVSAEVREV